MKLPCTSVWFCSFLLCLLEHTVCFCTWVLSECKCVCERESVWVCVCKGEVDYECLPWSLCISVEVAFHLNELLLSPASPLPACSIAPCLCFSSSEIIQVGHHICLAFLDRFCEFKLWSSHLQSKGLTCRSSSPGSQMILQAALAHTVPKGWP